MTKMGSKNEYPFVTRVCHGDFSLRYFPSYFDYFELQGLEWHEYFELLIQGDLHVVGSL